MVSWVIRNALLCIAAIPFIYYTIALFSSWRFFAASRKRPSPPADFTPGVSILKPVCGLDPEAYENFASFCRQDYPDYEIVFCAGDSDDPSVPVVERLARDFAHRRVRMVYLANHNAANDKVAKLAKLVSEADNEVLVINDADVRVRPDYLRSVVAPLRNPKVGGVTCLYGSVHDKTFLQKLQSMGMICDFYPGILVARQLDGVKFALGQTIVTTRARIAGFGGYQVLENRPADDLLVGRFIEEQGYEVELLPYTVETVADFATLRELVFKRLRWMTVMRHMRPWGHLGLIFTQGLAWSLLAVAIQPTASVAIAYLGTYAVLRVAMTWLVGVYGMKQKGLWSKMPIIPVWDAAAFLIWIFSFGRRSIRWRGVDYSIREGMLVPVGSSAGRGQASF
jgi:ceramide glucosyltransferase